MELPEKFCERMRQLMNQEEYAQFISSYEEPRSYGLRSNPLKPASLKHLQLEPVAWCNTGYYYRQEQRPGIHPLHEAGAYYIQEPSAMAIAPLLDVKRGEKVLDLCAAPGGKTTQLAGEMKGEGLLVANEYVSSRAKVLSQNVERMGVRNCVVLNETPQHLAQVFEGFFDKILVDAPCSGEGMFRKEEIARQQWSLDNVTICEERQKEILACAVRMLAPGGRLVYSTCTFSPQEDEYIVEWLLETYSDLTILPMNKVGGMEDARVQWSRHETQDVKRAARLWPHKLRGEGHFAAVFENTRTKEPVTNSNGKKSKAKKKSPAVLQVITAYEEFAKEYLDFTIEGRYEVFGNRIYLVPEQMIPLDGLKVQRAGLEFGEETKGRFTPAHALAMALTDKEVTNSCELGDKAADYLHGEVIHTSTSKGWMLMTVDGVSIGWGKGTGTQIKNHYPKGLRK
ncbi:RsmF rRNA methyltransferase first C-terminal domain-containing protein [Eubacterium oxidoreducens]|uniref:NOL1/NOP2/sun family putative RNA methylase n=1 Tax=Eubacterium oxidoreducens TaxID=1732 RepID=A0A1G6CA78_EUBOX|nr:RsmF rRNA methyltransferase first C-terminal domain-containing protein [Eubacterium oxidoreducens]SDB29788.1 NOL1/NOP2/sun family putative RNA methylase [Eubacterium oxidoreducens]